MAFVTASDGIKLYTEVHEPDSGSSASVLFSCGLCTTHENWRAQVAPLTAAGFRVMLWDYRGHGKSDAPGDPAAYSMERVVEDLGRVLDALEPDRPAVLAGLSFGGLASLHYAVANPERVQALVLAGSGPGFKKREAQQRWEAMVERTAGFIETKGLVAFVASRAAVTAIGLRPELPAARAAGRAIAAQDPTGLACFARRVAAPAPPVIDELASIACPCLVLVGEKDEAYLRAAEVMTARLPAAQRVTLADAGHIANIEQAEAFNAAVICFLQGISPGPAGPRGG